MRVRSHNSSSVHHFVSCTHASRFRALVRCVNVMYEIRLPGASLKERRGATKRARPRAKHTPPEYLLTNNRVAGRPRVICMMRELYELSHVTISRIKVTHLSYSFEHFLSADRRNSSFHRSHCFMRKNKCTQNLSSFQNFITASLKSSMSNKYLVLQ